ncbi:hypothetical protein ACG1VR_10930 [Cedecea davisae]|uniref:hypothetical protein n=1 Tax=Cedecea davisae TaxID=158484 RepID=UPI00376EF87A
MNSTDVNVRYEVIGKWPDIGLQKPLSVTFDSKLYHISSPVFEQTPGQFSYNYMVLREPETSTITYGYGDNAERIDVEFKAKGDERSFVYILQCTDKYLGSTQTGSVRIFPV